MFHCHRLLSQVHIPKLTHRHILTGYNISSHTTNAAVARSKIIRADALPLEYALRRNATSDSARDVGSRWSKSWTPAPFAMGKVAKGKAVLEVGAYRQLRHRDRSLVANLPTDSYLHVLNRAMEAKSYDLVDQVVLDILEIYKGEDTQRNNMLRKIVLAQDLPMLKHDTVLSILRHLQRSYDGLDFLSSRSVELLARMMADTSPWNDIDRSLLAIIHPILLVRIQRCVVPSGAFSLTYHPPAIIHASFNFTHRLLMESCQSQALDVFQKLVDAGQIPPEATQKLDGSSNNFKLIICSALVRASLQWNWRNVAANILTDLLESPHSPDQYVIDLNIDTIHALLEMPTSGDIRTCGHLIRKVHPHAPVPNNLIRQYYNSTAQLSLGDEAEALYSFTRIPSVVKNHQYPPPQGVALSWLMYHLTIISRKTQLSRQLATEVVEGNLPIPLQSRARFLSIAAAQGYGILARNLWERYSIGKDRHVVVGNSALMIRMVSLFENLVRRTETIIQRRRSEDPTVQFADDETLQKRLEDLVAFLDRVLLEYRTLYEPLANAHHQVLTSLARASFIVGKFAEGFEAFKMLLDRKEVPDLYDVNVALTAMAELKPRLAARMIERMIRKGLQPDAVTFGTVMHYALLHKDADLVNSMLEKLRGLKDTRLRLKSVATLIRASVAPDGEESKVVQRSKLESALVIINSLTDSRFVSSPQIGKYLVFASLRADDPVLAYKFWKQLLKGSTEWDDREQRFQRRLIAQSIQRHREELSDDQILDMLSQLRRRPCE